MYEAVNIHSLTNPQISKLLRGEGVRIQRGNSHTIHLSKEQAKKFKKNHEKGKGMVVHMDPYQMHGHEHLRGTGFMSAAKNVFRHGVNLAKKHVLPMAKKFIQDEAHKLRGPAERLVEKTLNPYFGEPLAHDLAMKGSQQGFNALESGLSHAENHIQGMGIRRKGGSLKSIGRHIRSDFQKVGRVLKPVGQQVLNAVKPYARTALHDIVNYGAPLALGAVGSLVGNPELATMAPALTMGLNNGVDSLGHKYGFGVHKKKRAGRPRKGGALYPAGY